MVTENVPDETADSVPEAETTSEPDWTRQQRNKAEMRLAQEQSEWWEAQFFYSRWNDRKWHKRQAVRARRRAGKLCNV